MSETVKIVVGAGYGDEGKGATVAHFVSQDPSADWAVVRFNGGAQAGHTVVNENCKTRFVFHHFGSGTLHGAATVFGNKFLIDPMSFMTERAKLIDIMGSEPKAYSLPDAQIQHPTDMLINRMLEQKRGNNRHGSCGYGIFETVNRAKTPEFSMTFGEAKKIIESGQEVDLIKWVFDVFYKWAPLRFNELGVDRTEYFKYLKIVSDDFIFGAEQALIDAITTIETHDKLGECKFIFEGAQGLGLSETHMEDFPHLTPSDTGITNAFSDAGVLGIPLNKLQPVYVTRAYSTRHGAGPLAYEGNLITKREGNGISFIHDPTNSPNDWQGMFRCAPLNVDKLIDNIQRDITPHEASRSLSQEPLVALRCIDQLNDVVTYYYNGEKCTVKSPELADVLSVILKGNDIIVHRRNLIEFQSP